MNKIAMYKEEIIKTASQKKDELYKEAGLVTHASKATNGIRRAGQLLTGSHVKGLRKSLNTMQNAPATNLNDSIKMGKKMKTTQNALTSEIGKVKKARLGAVGTGVGVAGGATIASRNKKQQGVSSV